MQTLTTNILVLTSDITHLCQKNYKNISYLCDKTNLDENIS